MNSRSAALEDLYIEALVLKDEGASLLWTETEVSHEDIEVRVGRICEAIKFDARLTMVLEHLLCWRLRGEEIPAHPPGIAGLLGSACMPDTRAFASMTADQRRVIHRSLDLIERVAALRHSGNDDAQRRHMRLQMAYGAPCVMASETKPPPLSVTHGSRRQPGSVSALRGRSGATLPGGTGAI